MCFTLCFTPTGGFWGLIPTVVLAAIGLFSFVVGVREIVRKKNTGFGFDGILCIVVAMMMG
jgi:hypothetical protein